MKRCSDARHNSRSCSLRFPIAGTLHKADVTRLATVNLLDAFGGMWMLRLARELVGMCTIVRGVERISMQSFFIKP